MHLNDQGVAEKTQRKYYLTQQKKRNERGSKGPLWKKARYGCYFLQIAGGNSSQAWASGGSRGKPASSWELGGFFLNECGTTRV